VPRSGGRSPLNVASLLARLSPDSIYLASEHTLGVVDLGDRVVVWVGRHYASAVGSSAAGALRAKAEHGDKDKRLRNSGVSKITMLIHKLHKYALHVAGVLPAFSARGVSGLPSSYPCTHRYPPAKVSVITQHSPNSRLLFTRLASAHNDNKFLIRQYCEPTFYRTAIRVAHQLLGDAPSLAKNAKARAEAALIPESEAALDLFMEDVAYLPPTDTPSFLRHLAELVPGVIQKFSQSSAELAKKRASAITPPPAPPPPVSSMLDIFTIFPPPQRAPMVQEKTVEANPVDDGIAGCATELADLNQSCYGKY
jgi:hypothetical protein